MAQDGKVVVRIGDTLQNLGNVEFSSRQDARQWLERNGFVESSATVSTAWIRRGAAYFNFKGESRWFSGNIVARVHELQTLEEFGFRPA